MSWSGDRSGPIIVLTYAYAGAGFLIKALSADTSLACTEGTGLLPMCDQVAGTWQKLEGRGGVGLSSLATRSVRALTATMTAAVLSAAGAVRWCEVAFAAPSAAETFLRLFPETTFICLYRGLMGVLSEGLRAHPWGLGDSPFWSHADGCCGNNLATIAAYWVSRSESLMDFEANHDKVCHRVIYEQLAADPYRDTRVIFERLGLDDRSLVPGATQITPADIARQETISDSALIDLAGRIPAPLLARAEDLHARLGLAFSTLSSAQ